MAANPTTENRAKEQRARKITTYDLIIGILAIFSLIILIPIYFGHLSSQDIAVLLYTEDALCVVFLLDFFRSLHLAQSKWGYFLRGGGWLDLLGSIPISAFAIFRFARLFRVLVFEQSVDRAQQRLDARGVGAGQGRLDRTRERFQTLHRHRDRFGRRRRRG